MGRARSRWPWTLSLTSQKLTNFMKMRLVVFEESQRAYNNKRTSDRTSQQTRLITIAPAWLRYKSRGRSHAEKTFKMSTSFQFGALLMTRAGTPTCSYPTLAVYSLSHYRLKLTAFITWVIRKCQINWHRPWRMYRALQWLFYCRPTVA